MPSEERIELMVADDDVPLRDLGPAPHSLRRHLVVLAGGAHVVLVAASLK
jgi:hypothetical protein